MRLIKFDIAVQTTYNIESILGATIHGGSKKVLSQLEKSAILSAKSNARAAWIFSSPWLSVFEHAAVRKGAARLTKWI